MPQTTVRVVGSGYTVLSFNNKPIAYCEGWEDSGQRAFSDIGQPYQFLSSRSAPSTRSRLPPAVCWQAGR
jgi:hypothetical protein